MKINRYPTNKGFTLVELAVALALLLIISSIALVSYNKFIDSAREAAWAENLNGLQNAVQVYVSENAALPATLVAMTMMMTMMATGMASKG